MRGRARAVLLATCTTLLATAAASAQTRVTSPQQQFGHEIGADYVLPNYTDLTAYWQKLAKESDRMVLDTIGHSAEGRPQLMAIISSPENIRNLDRLKANERRLAMADGLTEDQARQLAHDTKAVVWIDGGLHATEVLGAQQLMEIVYQLVSMDDPETLRFLNDLVILCVQVNPDGMELVSNWYMRNQDAQRRSTNGIPRLYEKYAGHDDNRDFYMANLPETQNDNQVMYRTWYPVVVYNHHQTGPAGAVMFSPPFRDPPNYYFDSAIQTGLEIVGGSMHDRFVTEHKPGVTMRSGSNYSTWWNGGLRTMAYFHNMIGLLTETIGNPTPEQIPFIPDRLLSKSDLPLPIEPQPWHFRQSVDYSITADRAVLDIVSRRREEFLYNMYLMAKRAIDNGNRDHWTDTPSRIAAATEKLAGPGRRGGGAAADADEVGGGGGGGRGGRGGGGTRADFERMMRDPSLRDARGYILPSSQPDFLTATKFVQALTRGGVQVGRATRDFQVNGKTYPAGSYVVKAAQPFRAHVIDMFEPQDHPNDLAYPGGPPIPPYDNAGYTLAFTMGVQFDRIVEGFDAPVEMIPGPDVAPPPGRVAGSGNAGFLLSHEVNDAFVAVNRLLKAKKDVYWLQAPFTANGHTWPAGTFYIPAAGGVRPLLDDLAKQKGLVFEATGTKAGSALKLQPVRIGLLDRYGGSMPSGWTRFEFEQFEFPFEVIYPQTIDAGNLRSKYDVLVFVDGMIPAAGGGGRGGRGGGGGGGFGGPDTTSLPAEFRGWVGNITADRSIPQIKAFLDAGGTVITIGSSTSLATHLGLPVKDHLVEVVNGEERSLPRTKFYVPGSVLTARVDQSQPAAAGLAEHTDFFFDSSPLLQLPPGAELGGVKAVAWFDNPHPLHSGWALGETYLDGGVIAAEAAVGKGHLYLYTPEILFRGQPHGTFKLLFNGIYYGPAASATMR